MSAPPYMKLFWGDYHKRTRHLTRDQHGAYFLLIGEAWQLGGALPDDDAKLAAWALCTRAEWAAIKPIVMEFFSLRRGKWWQDRVREELASYEATSRKRKEAGKKGGKASVGNTKGNKEANACLLPTKPEPEPEPVSKIEAKASLSSAPPSAAPMTYPEPFEAAWKAYPHVKGRSSKPKALGYWRRLPPATREALPSAIARYARDGREPKAECGAPAMQRWLAEARFSDWMPEAESLASGAWDDGRWSAVIALNREEGWWSADLGPPPGQPGCRVPAHLIERQAA